MKVRALLLCFAVPAAIPVAEAVTVLAGTLHCARAAQPGAGNVQHLPLPALNPCRSLCPSWSGMSPFCCLPDLSHLKGKSFLPPKGVLLSPIGLW